MHYWAGFKILLSSVAAELNLVLRKSMTSASRVALVVKRLAAFLFSLVFQMMLSVLAMNQTTGSCRLSSTLKSRRMTWAGVRLGTMAWRCSRSQLLTLEMNLQLNSAWARLQTSRELQSVHLSLVTFTRILLSLCWVGSKLWIIFHKKVYSLDSKPLMHARFQVCSRRHK